MVTAPSAPELAAAMVEELRGRGYLRSDAVADAFLAVPRHLFVPATPLREVYSADVVVPTHFDSEGVPISSSSAPNIMATMLEQLDVRPGMRVLEIGAGTGYNAGLMARLVGTHGRVITVDIDDDVASEARAHLREAGIARVEVVRGDGWFGARGNGEFDRVIATVGAWEVSPHWLGQLRDGGILVMPLWLRPGVQVSVAFVREQDRLRSVTMCACGFMRLRGSHAGADTHVVVPGWGDRVHGATPDSEWLAAIEAGTVERIDRLRALLASPVSAQRVELPAPGWTVRLALEEPDVIAFSGRRTMYHFAAGLFTPERGSLALFDAGLVVAFGDPYCADRLRARLPALAPIDLEALDIRAEVHPVGPRPGAWVLERPSLDLVVREGPVPTAGGAGEPARAR